MNGLFLSSSWDPMRRAGKQTGRIDEPSRAPRPVRATAPAETWTPGDVSAPPRASSERLDDAQAHRTPEPERVVPASRSAPVLFPTQTTGPTTEVRPARRSRVSVKPPRHAAHRLDRTWPKRHRHDPASEFDG